MLANERRNKICDMLTRQGAVTSAELFEIFDVSIETIRRDLLALEEEGKLTRVHGGAVSKGNMKSFFTFDERVKSFSKEKHELSLKALEFIEENDIIAIDAGSTAIIFAEAIKERFSSLTVVTFSMDVFNILANHKDMNVILCGGHYQKAENAFYGELALDTLKKLHVKKAFIFPSAVSISGGVCDYQEVYYQLQRYLFKCADEIFVLADSSKFEKKALLNLAPMSPDHKYVTDSHLPEIFSKLYADNKMTVYMADKIDE